MDVVGFEEHVEVAGQTLLDLRQELLEFIGGHVARANVMAAPA